VDTEDAPVSGPRETQEPDIHATLRDHGAKLDEILALLRARGQQSLPLVGAR